jgi:hypothetical protein
MQVVPSTYKKRSVPIHEKNQPPNPKWTPLNANLSMVFMEVRKDPSFKWPPFEV